MEKQESPTHHGQRLDELLKFLKTDRGILQKQFCDDLDIRQTSINYWQNKRVFSQSMWNKLKPVLLKYNLNMKYIKGYSERMEIDPDQENEDKKFRDEMKEGFNEMIHLLKEIRDKL